MDRRAAAVLVCALVLAGCGLRTPAAPTAPATPTAAASPAAAPGGGIPAAAITATAALTLRQVAAPASAAPASGIRDVAFTSAAHGVLVTGGLRMGTANGTTLQGTGRIQVTEDGGRTWTTVWQSTTADLDWVGFADAQHGFAAGATFPAASAAGTPLLLTTADGGRTWRAIRPSLPASAAAAWSTLRFDFVSPSAGYAVTDADFSVGPGEIGGVLHTSDGGRTWTMSPLSGGTATGGLAFVGATTGFATGSSQTCLGAIWRTADSGATWHLLPPTCSTAFRLHSLDFVDAAHGFAGGGRTDKFGSTDWQAVLATADGGKTWTTVHLNRATQDTYGGAFTRLHFVDARHGWAVTGGCVMGQNSPCAGEVLVTSDGGRTWAGTGQDASHLAVADAAHAWAVPPDVPGHGLLWTTANGGSTWTPLGQAKAANYALVRTSGTTILAAGEAGFILSTDGGRTWGRIPLSIRGGLPQEAAVGPHTLAVPAPDGQALLVSGNRGATWTPTAIPGASATGLGPFALTPGADGLAATRGLGCAKGGRTDAGALLATMDGGRTWTPLPTPPFPFDELADSPGLAAGVGDDNCTQAVAVSRDGGRTWHAQTLPHGTFCTTVSVTAPRTLWLGCGGTLLVSQNGGGAWTQLTAPGLQIDSLAPGWMAANGALWRTADGGRTWTEVWPAIQ